MNKQFQSRQYQSRQYQIGDAAEISGINAKLIRHYESIGLIPKAKRTDSGYRTYSESDIQVLAFVRRARALGFSMKEIKKLVGLWKNKARASSEVKALAVKHIEEMEAKIATLQDLVFTLKHLSKNCHGDNRPECPILENLGRTHNL